MNEFEEAYESGVAWARKQLIAAHRAREVAQLFDGVDVLDVDSNISGEVIVSLQTKSLRQLRQRGVEWDRSRICPWLHSGATRTVTMRVPLKNRPDVYLQWREKYEPKQGSRCRWVEKVTTRTELECRA